MKNSTIKSVIAVLFLVFIIIVINKVENNRISFLIALIPILIILFNFLVRKNPKFKPYFLSPLNIFSAQTQIVKSFELSKEILVEKFKEVLETADFKIAGYEENEGVLSAYSSTTWRSWGENVYIEIGENGKVIFTSVAVGQIYTWGKNQANLEKLVHTFESSLTI